MIYYDSAPDEKRIQISETEYILQSEYYTKYLKTHNISNGKPYDVLHRLGGFPAIDLINGDKWFYEDGLYHRENDLPAIETQFCKQWFIHGKFFRKNNQPTSVSEDAIFYHDENEDFHRLDGPAVIYLRSKEEFYYVRGHNVTLSANVHSVEDLHNYLNKQILL